MSESGDQNVQLLGTVTDAGQVVSGMVIHYSNNPLVTVSGVGLDTYTVHAVNNIDDELAGTGVVSYGTMRSTAKSSKQKSAAPR